jgi:hypothetical protein
MYLPELSWLYLAQLFRFLAVGLCLGTSTVVMTLYFFLVAKGRTESAEKRVMHILYTILRVGMALALITEGTCLIYHYHIDNFIYWTDNPELLMRLTIFSVILINAIAMQYHKISMWLGPVFAGGSWYAYFFFSVWIETESTYPVLFVGYLIWLTIVFFILAALRLFLTRKQKHRLGDGALSASADAC